jgi:hypothetical protein
VIIGGRCQRLRNASASFRVVGTLYCFFDKLTPSVVPSGSDYYSPGRSSNASKKISMLHVFSGHLSKPPLARPACQNAHQHDVELRGKWANDFQTFPCPLFSGRVGLCDATPKRYSLCELHLYMDQICSVSSLNHLTNAWLANDKVVVRKTHFR